MSRSALLGLADGVRAYFERRGLEIVVGKCGRRQREQWIENPPSGVNRVLFMQPKGDRGTLTRGHQQTGNPPVLVQWNRPIIVSIWGGDPAHQDDEEAQIAAVEDLLEKTLQGIREAVDPVTGQAVNFSNLTFGAIREVDDEKENYFGIEYQIPLVLHGPLFGRELETTRPKGEITRPATLAGPVS